MRATHDAMCAMCDEPPPRVHRRARACYGRDPSRKGSLMRRIVLVATGLLLLTAAFASPGGASVRDAASDPSTATGAMPAFSHAFVIVGENTARGNMTPKDMPYAFGTLK